MLITSSRKRRAGTHGLLSSNMNFEAYSAADSYIAAFFACEDVFYTWFLKLKFLSINYRML